MRCRPFEQLKTKNWKPKNKLLRHTYTIILCKCINWQIEYYYSNITLVDYIFRVDEMKKIQVVFSKSWGVYDYICMSKNEYPVGPVVIWGMASDRAHAQTAILIFLFVCFFVWVLFFFLFFLVVFLCLSQKLLIIYAFVTSLRTLWPRNDAWIFVAARFNSGSLKSISNSSATFFVISCRSLSSLSSLPPFRAKWPRNAAWMRTAASHNSGNRIKKEKKKKSRNDIED